MLMSEFEQRYYGTERHTLHCIYKLTFGCGFWAAQHSHGLYST